MRERARTQTAPCERKLPATAFEHGHACLLNIPSAKRAAGADKRTRATAKRPTETRDTHAHWGAHEAAQVQDANKRIQMPGIHDTEVADQ